MTPCTHLDKYIFSDRLHLEERLVIEGTEMFYTYTKLIDKCRTQET